MSNMKIFLSSTCYDLSVYREVLQEFFTSLGHESTLSDYGDVCYDPREHTHLSCINSVKEHDVLVVIIGARFGSEVIPKIFSDIDINTFINESNRSDIFQDIDKISITQAEVLTAIKYNIPIYPLVDNGVYTDFRTYKFNDKNIDIRYPHIDKAETTQYVFEFIDFLTNRHINNAIETYQSIGEIKNYLSKQWSKYFKKLLVEQKKLVDEVKKDICINDKTRYEILNNFNPTTYIPLKNNFCDFATSSNCDTSVYPYVMVKDDYVEKVSFSDKGYTFNGKNMMSIHYKEVLPYEAEERSFIVAINPTQLPKNNKPMFFFSYGQRFSHKCDDGTINHDKSFGLYYGEPAPEKDDEEIPKKYKGRGVRIFFYCEKCKKDRNSENCDTIAIDIMENLNEWYIFALTYSVNNELKLYLNGTVVFNEQYILDTSKTPYLNLGGFVHHNEKGAMKAADLDYSMKGNIREFMMFKNRCLEESEIIELSKHIDSLL